MRPQVVKMAQELAISSAETRQPVMGPSPETRDVEESRSTLQPRANVPSDNMPNGNGCAMMSNSREQHAAPTQSWFTTASAAKSAIMLTTAPSACVNQ